MRVVAVSCCGFAAVLGGLSLQMASGADPALGPKARTALVAQQTQTNQASETENDPNETTAVPDSLFDSDTDTTSGAGSATVAPTSPAPVQSGAS